jgi:hypothetical protein
MEAGHMTTSLGKPISPITAVDRFDKHQQEKTIEWLRTFS